MIRILFFAILLVFLSAFLHAEEPVRMVNPFIGTTNYGTTQPGPCVPGGMVSMSPFNTIPKEGHRISLNDWCSTPFEYTNSWCAGFTQVNLSGVGCPDLGSLLLMPTHGELNVDYMKYAAPLHDMKASPGYFSCTVGENGITAQMTTTRRTTRSRYTFPAGESHVLFNIGKGLSSESGCYARRVGDREVEGFRLMGDFCFEQPQSVIPIYFVVRLSSKPSKIRYWKKQPMLDKGFSWSKYNDIYKVYEKYQREIAGDQIGVAFTFETHQGQAVEVSVGVSYVSIENARVNLDTEQSAQDSQVSFDSIVQSAAKQWAKVLSVVSLKGGTPNERAQFYTALYHNWIHPNTLCDVNGQYPMMGGRDVGQMPEGSERLTMFSGWDVYRISPFAGSLFYPERTAQMARTLVDMYRENGALPKFEIAGHDFQVMEGDPALPYLASCYVLGLTQSIDSMELYQAMLKNAVGATYVRGNMNFYNQNHYVPLTNQFDNSVSEALELYVADWSLAQVAQSLGRKDDAKMLTHRAMGYKKYFDPSLGLLRPVLPDGHFRDGFDPLEGRNFSPSNGFHEGCSWNYSFAVPYDVNGLIKLFGSPRKFVNKLDSCFLNGYFDMGNEPDMIYPFLFSYVRGSEWRTQYWVNDCLKRYFANTPGGLPGNDDAGTMSAWQMFAMMGIYPVSPAKAEYVITTPTFDRVEIRLDPRYHRGHEKLIIEAVGRSDKSIYIDRIELNGRPYNSYLIDHEKLVEAGRLTIYCTNKPKKRI